MQEFGSDFHHIDSYQSRRAHLTDVYGGAWYMADGRQCLIALIRQCGWKRMWVPEYFCYEVIESLRQMTDIEIVFYQDFPTNDARGTVATLPYRDGDVLLRVNYFGMRDFRSENVPVPVIEDHTHDLMGHWSLYSEADWCIASLRKSLPIPEGGMMWSPKGLPLGEKEIINIEKSSSEAEIIGQKRWKAMEMKTAYLRGEDVKKEDFRKILVETEEWFDTAEPIVMDERSMAFVQDLDINAWMNVKKRNWRLLCQLVNTKAQVLKPEDESCNMFSFLVLAPTAELRERWRRGLIERDIYPAVLWSVPENTHAAVRDISSRILSIHCDGRYSPDEIEDMAKLINQVFES